MWIYITDKVPLPTFYLLVLLLIAFSMYPLYAKENVEKSEYQDHDSIRIMEEKEGPHAFERREAEQPAVAGVQRKYVLSDQEILSEKEPSQEKANEPVMTAKTTVQAEEKEEEIANKTFYDNDIGTAEALPAAIKPEQNEIREESRTAFNHIETVSQVNFNATLNQYVLDIIATYEIEEERYPYILNNDYANYNGVTRTLTYQGEKLLRAHPSGNKASHCVGITFEVFFRAMQQRNRELGIPVDDFNGMSYNELFDCMMNWFAASASKKTNNIAIAVEKYGIGERLYNLQDVRPGDFIDFNRQNGTGHTAIFINWIRKENRIIGLRYWSSQPSTGGISYHQEYFNVAAPNATNYGNVLIDQMYMVRILPVSHYKK